MIDVTVADETANDARARSNVIRLAAAQALTGANSAVIFATGSIIGATLAPDISLATVPLSMYVVGLAAGTLPTGAISRAYGRRVAFIAGTGCGVLTGLLGAFAILHGSFPLFCCATFLGGLYGAVSQSYRFAAAAGASAEFRPKPVSWVMAGGVFAGVLGPGWNLSFVGGSALVLETHRPQERNKVQGFNDFLVFGMMAVGSFSSGQLLANYGWSAVNIVVFKPVLLGLAVLAASSFAKRRATSQQVLEFPDPSI